MFDRILDTFCDMGRKLFKNSGCNTSCDVLWIIILLLILFNGGLFGLDICTIAILFIIFGGNLFGGGKGNCHKPCH